MGAAWRGGACTRSVEEGKRENTPVISLRNRCSKLQRRSSSASWRLTNTENMNEELPCQEQERSGHETRGKEVILLTSTRSRYYI